MEEEVYWLGFSCCPGIGPVKFQQLLTYFKTAKSAWEADELALKEAKIGLAAVESIVTFRKKFSLLEYGEQLKRKHIQFIIQNQEYPKLLGEISRPPYVLYTLGDSSLCTKDNLIAVVGTRKVTEYGKRITEMLTAELVHAGFVIVSGLAIGVDAIAHTVALQADGKTIAVLGSGVDVCTPRENIQLYNRIIEKGGLIISEVPLGTIPNKGSFPSRNRIIAGLCQGVLVTEGAQDSGSLITANLALENHRKVFAVPGPITSGVSRGPHALIKKGAKMVMSIEDITGELGSVYQSRASLNQPVIKGDSHEENKIIGLLCMQNETFDALVKKLQISPGRLGVLLSFMEMKGYIIRLTTGCFTLRQ